ncbi:hypothetical protein [Myxococcus landrumensis]|uniref:Zinc-finger domain-containing protein n=1 Tax=Myxococcus landrumensis TaxID=2813577 RepID=A0ABX7NJ67_9BACT|nr:hypothetical protein [Myxococcus landrumus]QSQ17620.1 hypothetical protein JY572_16935 [Myxococcus landrumus]
MTPSSRHPSFLALDRAALGVRDALLDAHLEACAECRAYVLRPRDAEPIPAWVREAPPARVESFGREGPWGRFLAATATAALVAGAVVLSMKPDALPPPAVAAKGTPVVAVHLKRGDQVFLWDGQSLLQPGDRIRLSVVSEPHRYVYVGAWDSGGLSGWSLLFAGPLTPGAPLVLPASWRVDAAEGDEHLRVLFSEEPLTEPEALQLFPLAPQGMKLWTVELRLPKSHAP